MANLPQSSGGQGSGGSGAIADQRLVCQMCHTLPATRGERATIPQVIGEADTRK